MLRTMIKFGLLPMAILTLTLLPLTGCNTMEGFGKDVQDAGESIEEGAED